MKNEHFETIAMLITPAISHLELGEITDCEGLLDPEFWNAHPAPEQWILFCRPISVLVAQGAVPLEYVGFDREHNDLYKKI